MGRLSTMGFSTFFRLRVLAPVAVAGTVLVAIGYALGSGPPPRVVSQATTLPVRTPEISPESTRSPSPLPSAVRAAPSCPRMAVEDIRAGIRAAYQEEVGRDATYAEEDKWVRKYRSREAECWEGVPSPQVFVGEGVRETWEAAEWRIVKGIIVLRDDMRGDPTPTPSPTPTPAPTPPWWSSPTPDPYDPQGDRY